MVGVFTFFSLTIKPDNADDAKILKIRIVISIIFLGIGLLLFTAHKYLGSFFYNRQISLAKRYSSEEKLIKETMQIGVLLLSVGILIMTIGIMSKLMI